ncbi:MAG TPA: hypothetical protein VGF58_12305 [Burkholderiales bacterium]|jgi:hypothetical protein
MLSPVLTALTAAALALCLLEPAWGQRNAFVVPYTGTLKKVNESGMLRIGYRENSPTWSAAPPPTTSSGARSPRSRPPCS